MINYIKSYIFKMQYDEKNYSLMKLWHYIKGKTLKNRNIKKLSSDDYYNDDNLKQLSDNESDKTETESINQKQFIERGRISSLTNKSNKSNKSNDCSNNKSYDKRDNSLDIVRNEKDDYEVVMQYQRYSNNRTKNIFNIKEIKKLDNEMLIASEGLKIK